MTTLSPPPQTRTIGTALISGKPVAVQADIAWFRYWAQGVYDRIGGATGASTDDLATSAFEDAGVPELFSMLYALQDATGQANEVAALREELATLRQRLEAIEQGVNL